MSRTKQVQKKSGNAKLPRKKLVAQKLKSSARSSDRSSARSSNDSSDKSPEKAKVARTYRFRPGTVALREIKKYQKSTSLLLRKTGFLKMVKSIVKDVDFNFRIQSSAALALQQAAEGYLMSLLQDSSLCAVHAKRVLLVAKDMKLARRIRGDLK